MTPDDVLLVLNDCRPYDLAGCQFAVATAPADQTFDVLRQCFVDRPCWWPFQRGEVIVVGPDGREPFGEQRKPSKWSVRFEYFGDLQAAINRRYEVLAEEAPAGATA